MQKRERIYIVFHWAGLVFGLLVFFIFALGFVMVSTRSLTHTLGITLVVAGVVALIQSNENLRGIAITGCRSVPVPAGEDVTLELTLRNSSRNEHIGLRVRTDWRFRPRSSAWLPMIGAEETAAVRLNLPTSKRGRFAVPTLWVCSIMPVGLCFAWKVFSEPGEYIVYPAPRGVPLDHSLYGVDLGMEQGAHHSHGNEDVSDHRPYTPGDMLSRMDWRVFARTGKLVVRAFEEGRGDAVTLRWEDTRFLDSGEARLEQLSFWITQCVAEGRRFTLHLGHSHPRLNNDNLAACHEALATFGFEA